MLRVNAQDQNSQKATSEEFAKALLELMSEGIRSLGEELQKYAEEEWKLDPDEVSEFGTQLFIVHLWMVSKILGRDTRF